jgi:hypothetical protein
VRNKSPESAFGSAKMVLWEHASRRISASSLAISTVCCSVRTSSIVRAAVVGEPLEAVHPPVFLAWATHS